MADAALEAVLRRDRTIVAASLAMLTVIAWGYVLWLAHAMSVGDMSVGGMPMSASSSMGGDMGGMTMTAQTTAARMSANPFHAAMIPSLQPWSATEFLLAFAMWAVMMVGMMTPSAASMILIYARVGRQAERQGKPLAATGYFAGGYLLAWTVFSLVATSGQWALERATLLAPTMQTTSSVLGGLVLIAAGLFQWSPVKDACLRHCQAPLMFIQHVGGFRRDPLGSIWVGFRHGIYCMGCCWALMALLFVGGIMNVLWIAGIAIFVLAEKVVASSRMLTRLAGVILVAAGLWLLLQPLR